MEVYSFPQVIHLSGDCYSTIDTAFTNEWLQMTTSLVSLINTVTETVILDRKPHWAPFLDQIKKARDLQRALAQFKGEMVAIQQSRESTHAWRRLLAITPCSAANSDFRDYAIYHLMDLFEHHVNWGAAVVRPGTLFGGGSIIIDSTAAVLLQATLTNQWLSASMQFSKLMKRISKDPRRWNTYDGWSYINVNLTHIMSLQNSIEQFSGIYIRLSTSTFELLTWFSTLQSIADEWCGWPGLRRRILSKLTTVIYKGTMAGGI